MFVCLPRDAALKRGRESSELHLDASGVAASRLWHSKDNAQAVDAHKSHVPVARGCHGCVRKRAEAVDGVACVCRGVAGASNW